MQKRRQAIERRSFLAASAGLIASCSSPPKPEPPNIVVFLADDLGYGDLSSYGCPDIRTPHIDAIGARGVRFTRCYANAPECTPTRAALLTGRYQQRAGGLECAIGVGGVGRYDEAVWLRERGELGLPASEATMGRIFKKNGYDTACIGKWHLGYPDRFSPNRHGFDEYFGILGGNAGYFTHREASGLPVLYRNGQPVAGDGYLTDLISGHAVEWLANRRANPFLLYVPFTAPHTPVQGPADAGREVNASNWNQGDRATYARMVESMDAGVGRVLAQLDAMGAADNTLVVFMSDNGGYALSRNEPFRGGKGTLWEGGIRVPCVMRYPGVVPEGTETGQVSLSMDLLPTLMTAAGIPQPPGRKLDGVDLLPVVSGARRPFVRTIHFRYKRLENRRKAVIHGAMKYLWDNGGEYLFNLADDAHEDENLLADFPGVAAELKSKLADWEEEVRAPRLAGFSAG